MATSQSSPTPAPGPASAPANAATEATPLLSVAVAGSKTEELPSWGEVLKFCARYLIPKETKYKFYVVFVTLLTIVDEALSLAPAVITKFIIDKIASGVGKVPAWELVPWRLLLLSFALGELGGLLGVLSNNYRTRLTAELSKQISVDLFEHLHNLSLGFHLGKKTGEVMKIMGRAAGSLISIFNLFAFTIVPLLAQTVLVAGIFFQFGLPIVSVVCVVAVAVYLGYTYFLTGIRTKLNRENQEADNAVGDCQVESLSAYEVVMSFGRSAAEVERYNGLSGAVQRASKKSILLESWFKLLQRIIQKSGRYLVVWIACGLTLAEGPGRLSAGDFTLIPSLYTRLFSPFRMLSYHYTVLTQSLTRLEQTVAVWKMKPEIVDRDDAIDLRQTPRYPADAREVQFENVSFRYKSDASGAPTGGGVTDLSFRACPDHTVALVGETGSGKTTTMRLLLRLYESQAGRISVSGIDIQELTQKSLREEIGIVSQQTVLFNDTLMYNIRYSKPEATREEVMEAARIAALEDFIEEQPKGLETIVGERGVKLSGGQLQRVGIARALLKNASILLLDEATAALDSVTERQVHVGLEALRRGKTTIMIAHRLATISGADEIIVLEKGVVKERGTHGELLKKGGMYAELWAIQGGKSAEPRGKEFAEHDVAEIEHLSD